jgi:hypothetical protein
MISDLVIKLLTNIKKEEVKELIGSFSLLLLVFL